MITKANKVDNNKNLQLGELYVINDKNMVYRDSKYDRNRLYPCTSPESSIIKNKALILVAIKYKDCAVVNLSMKPICHLIYNNKSYYTQDFNLTPFTIK